MIINHVTLRIKPEKEAAFLQDFKSLTEMTKQEDGCLSYDLCQIVGSPFTYMIVEVWEDQDAVEFHSNSDHFKTFIETSRINGYNAVPPRAIFYAAEISPN